MPGGRPSAIIDEARQRWMTCQEAEDAQRKAILAAKQFRAGNQWPDAIKIAREGGTSIGGLSPQPARPCLVVDRLSQPTRSISNSIKTADFTFSVVPVAKGADEDTAEIFKGYLRRVQNNARDDSPVEWAADQAIEGGIGWFRLRTDYVHRTWDGDVNDPALFDQEIKLERITNNLTVYCDPYANRPTRSDANFMFVTEDLDRDEFTRRYPKADLKGLDDWAGTGDPVAKTWVTKDAIRIAEYWRIEFTDRTFYWLKSDGSINEGAVPSDTSDVRMSRVMKVPVVKGSKLNAFEELETFEWVGSRIPLIPVLGEELNIDGQIKLRGVIEEGMDAQRMVNYTYSGAVELFALAPKNVPMVPASSIANYKNIWQTRTTTNWSFLPYDQYDENGREQRAPAFNPTEPPIQAAVSLMKVSEDAIKATTSLYDASLGSINPQQRSGRAIQSLQQQSDVATSNYPDNVRRALVYAGELMVEIIPKITRPGQVVHILDTDDQTKQVILGQVFNYGGINGGPVTKTPQPSPNVTPDQAALTQGLHNFYDLNKGTYRVTVVMGKSSATKIEEGRNALGDLIPKLPPEMGAVLAPEFIETLNMPGAHKMAEMARKALPPNLQPQPDGGPQSLPPAVQAQLQDMQQQLQQAQQFIQTEQAKQQAVMQKAQLEAQVDMQKAQLDADTRLKIAGIQAQASVSDSEVKAGLADAKNKIAILEIMIGAQKEERLQQMQLGHDAAMQGVQHRQERVQMAHEATQNTLDRVHEATQNAQQQAAQASQAAPQPTPDTGQGA